ncbi:MAG: UDP-N-acetylglucosamine 2-epimerase (non-hydrolyzing) [Actinobacteria bacterium]|nr:UDP-N-acetylglucosamine 2-epimerase (non-hydrolyzing) [Actinomycetota bacterium]
MKIINVAGARPNFMKIAPIHKLMKENPKFDSTILHTGQHYDENMSKVFFDDLGLPEPDVYLGVGSGSHAYQTAQIMLKFEEVVKKEKPHLIVVVGDVNSTLACSVVAAKLNTPIAHIEAGLRSFDRTMPEEINRIVTDSLSDFLFTTSEDANINLENEGVPKEKIYFVGNVMIDTLLSHSRKAQESNILNELNLKKNNYAVLTLHRPGNVDDYETFKRIIKALSRIQERIKIVFPAHPRTIARIEEFSLKNLISAMPNLIIIDSLGYLDFLCLMSNSKIILTDSGGIQEETTVLGIPCLTLRENTERPVTVSEGTNTIVGTDEEKITSESFKVIDGQSKMAKIPALWDGKAAERIINILQKKLNN